MRAKSVARIDPFPFALRQKNALVLIYNGCQGQTTARGRCKAVGQLSETKTTYSRRAITFGVDRARLVGLIRGAVDVEAAAYAALGFMLGRAVILDALSPFGLAFFCVVHLARRRKAIPAGLGTILGYLSFGVRPEGLISSLVLVAAHFSLVSFNVRVAATHAGRLGVAATTATLAVSLKSVILVITGPTVYEFIVIASEGILIFILTLIFFLGFPARQPSQRGLAGEEALCLAILLAAAITGLAGIVVGPLALQSILSGFLIAVMAYASGGGAGAATGVAVGVISGLSAGLSPAQAGLYGFSGLLAGVFRDLGKIGSALGFFLAMVLVSFYVVASADMVKILGEAGAAALLLAITPTRLLGRISSLAGEYPPGSGIPAVEVARPDPGPGRLREFARIFRELSQSFEQVAGGARLETEDEGLPRMLGSIASRVCETCAVYRTCWESDFFKTYKGMLDLLALTEISGSLSAQEVPEEFRRRCIHLGELVTTINYLFELYRLNRHWRKALGESREVVSGQLKGIAQVLDSLADEAETGAGTKAAREGALPILSYNWGASRRAKRGCPVSGDNYLVKELPGGRLLAVLSDGMGAGPRADLESRSTVTLLEQLLQAGLEEDAAIRTVNSVLLLRSAEETFATVDMTIIDLVAGNAEFLKIGAAPSFILRGQEIQVVRSSSLPIGILNNVEIDTTHRALRPGDAVVMISDGLLSGGEKEGGRELDWLQRMLVKIEGRNPQELAGQILGRAIQRGQDASDDLTVLVLKFGSRDGEEDERSPAARRRGRPRRGLSPRIP